MTTSTLERFGPAGRAASKALVWLLCALTAMPSWASGSTLLQEPPFTATEPPANVFVMLDDSASMAQYQLPIPAGITVSGTAGTTVTIAGEGSDAFGTWSARTWSIDRDFDWILRAPALNPLWYNPAIQYRPWNKDGTLMPNASVGGATLNTNWGAFGARANAAQLTERDPRQVPTGVSTYQSITAGAGRGLLGTDVVTPTSAMLVGRRVNLASPSVDFRYYKMPFDFGPNQGGGAPRNGHASIAWTTHNDVSSPLDLFSRPVINVAAVTQSGCFGTLAQCQAGLPPSPLVSTTTWSRQRCDGTWETGLASDPGPLTCYRARCPQDAAGTWRTGWQATPPTVNCGYSRPTCTGGTTYHASDPGPLNCGYTRRTSCTNSALTDFGASNPGTLTCYRTRGCSAGAAWSTWSTTNPGALPACWSRPDCGGTVQYFSGASPGNLACNWSRLDCNGNPQAFGTTSPGNLTCYNRQNCSNVNEVFTTNPGTLSCGFSRQDCGGAAQSFGTDPGALTCYSRRTSCADPSTLGPTATVLSPLTCPVAGELPVTYNPSTLTRNPSAVTKSPSTFTQVPTGGGTRTPSSVNRVETQSYGVTAPRQLQPVALVQATGSEVRNATPNTSSACPVGTTNRSCTVTPATSIPDPNALVPARYYTYTGTGDRGDPASYRVVQIDRMRPAAATYQVVDARTGAAPSVADSQRTDCAARVACTWAEEAQNFANWWLYYRNRLFAAQAVMADAMSSLTNSSQQQLRVGYGRINYFPNSINGWRTEPLETLGGTLPQVDGFDNPGALIRGVRAFTVGTPQRTEFFDWLFSLAWVGSTPNREALDSIGRYYSWSDNRGPWGATPGTNDALPQRACRRNFALLTTDGEWTNVVAGQPLLEGRAAPLAGPGTPLESDHVGGPAITGDGPNNGATFTYAPASWQQFSGGSSQSGTLTDAAVYYWNRDLRPDLPNVIQPITDPTRANPAFWQSMSTYIVGYGLSASMDTAATRDAVQTGAAVSWPSVDLSPTVISGGNRVNDNLRAALASRGNFYAATDTAELRAGILSSFRDIAIRQGSAGGVAVTGPAVTGTSLAFFPSYTTGKWTGTLRAYLSADLESLAQGNTVTPQWTASVPGESSRNVATSTARTTPVAFSSANLSAAQLAQLTTADATAAEIVSYLRGDASLELPASGSPGGRKFRRREAALGDFVNSTPLYVKAPDYGFGNIPTIGAPYKTYVENRRAGSVSSVYIGGNDGMFHAFDAQTGMERFAYVPRGVYPELAQLASPSYSHRYYVDGPVTGGDWHDGSGWRSVVVGTTGAGGASIFAIDTTNPTALTPASVMWDITKTDNDHVGHVMSRGVVGRVKTGPSSHKWVYITGNGVESVNNRAALLVIDLSNGAVTAIPVGPTWTSGAGDAARNGMGGVTVTYDSERTITEVYAGDKQGYLWRFDFSAGVPGGAKGFDGGNTALFRATSGGTPQPITAAPRLAVHPLGGRYVIFGTGKLYETGDGTDTATQAIHAVWMKDGHTTQVTPAQLHTVSVTTGGGGDRSFSLGGIDWRTKLGWTVSLTGGERIISDPSLDLGTMVISSFKPDGAESCDGGGTSYIYRFNFATGTVTGTLVVGVVGALTPLTTIPTGARTQVTVDPRNVVTGWVGGGAGQPQGSNAQCTVYSASIQGRPNVIAQTCPGFTPLRVWRQPVR